MLRQIQSRIIQLIHYYIDISPVHNSINVIELMQQLNLVLWNCREFCIEPQWTRIMPKLEQYSIVYYVASDRDLLKCSSSLHVDSVDIGTSDHLLLWVELGKVRKAKNSKSGK